MRLEGPKTTRTNARRLRRHMTPPEIALCLALRKNEAGLRFRRQHPAGPYVLDFYCAPARLCIEVDDEAHDRGDRLERDQARDAWLATHDVRVLRYPARDVLTGLEGVVVELLAIAVTRRDRNADDSPSSPSVALRAPPPPDGEG